MSVPSADAPCDQNGSASNIVKEATLKPSLSVQQRRIAYLRFGHAAALISLTVLVHASRSGAGEQLPLHALSALLSIVLVRAALVRLAVRPPDGVPAPLAAGIYHAVSASAIFGSCALHVVATRVRPEHMLGLIASAALDVCALWFRMASRPDTPRPAAMPLLEFQVYAGADVMVAMVVAMGEGWVVPAKVALGVRGLFNVKRLAEASSVILARDKLRRDNAETRAKGEHAD